MELGILGKALLLKRIIISFPTLIRSSRSQHDISSRPKLPSFLNEVANLHKNLNLGACLHARMYWASIKWGLYQFSWCQGKSWQHRIAKTAPQLVFTGGETTSLQLVLYIILKTRLRYAKSSKKAQGDVGGWWIQRQKTTRCALFDPWRGRELT